MSHLLSSDRQDAFDQHGFVVAESIIDLSQVESLRDRFERLYRGEFETGITPDEVNWQHGASDSSLTRQICNGWRADPEVARTVLNPRIGEAIAALAGWPGTRVIQDNVLWKPMGARSVGYHRDNQYLAWFAPREMYTCWIALDDTTEAGGTLEFARGSHKWPTEDGPLPQFHAPEDYRAPVNAAAFEQGQNVDIAHVEVSPGAGSFHHGWTWHGSGPNHSFGDRRALVIHCASSEATFDRDGMQLGTGPIYTRYAHLTDDMMDENYFPITWTTDGYRTPGLSGSDD